MFIYWLDVIRFSSFRIGRVIRVCELLTVLLLFWFLFGSRGRLPENVTSGVRLRVLPLYDGNLCRSIRHPIIYIYIIYIFHLLLFTFRPRATTAGILNPGRKVGCIIRLLCIFVCTLQPARGVSDELHAMRVDLTPSDDRTSSEPFSCECELHIIYYAFHNTLPFSETAHT